jgi:hypothetical protein
MAINIRIGTAFDNKGLNIANRELANLRGSVGALRSNFLVLGAALAGAFAGISRSLADAAESQKVFTQTEAVLRSTGTTANGTAREIANMAASLQESTSFNDEAILSGANLLLTFKNIRNEAGEGNDIFDQTTQTMLDVARAMGTDVSTEAIRLGKALNDPVAGISALSRVGIQFTEQQKEQIKVLTDTGDLLGAQKIILAELQSQFGGSAAAYAQTFAGQLEGLNNELNDLSEEIGMIVMPAVTAMVEEFKALIPVIGPQLKAAIESVDWAALVKSVVDFTKFLVENATAIVNVIIALFALNTIVKVANVLMGVAAVASKFYAWYLAQVATGASLATIATTLFSNALRIIPFVAVIAALIVMADTYTRTKTAIQNATTQLSAFEVETISAANAASQFSPYLNVLKQIITALITATGVADEFAEASNAASPNQAANRSRRNAMREANRRAGRIGGLASAVVPNFEDLFAQAGGAATVSALEAIPAFDSAAFTAEQEALRQQLEATNALLAEQAEAARKEQEMLDKRENAYKSFADSVKNLFGQIKNSILSSFDLPKLGNSVNSITRNIAKLLDRTKNFARNISELSGLGLNSALLQQVIQAGPMAGSQLAQAIVGGGSAFVGQLNQAYGEFGDLASGIAGVGTQAAFANQEVVNNYYQIEVSGGVGSGPTIGKAIVDAIKSYERSSGAVWQGA